MPFLQPDHKPSIKHPAGHPVDVCCTYNTIAQIRIDYFRIEDDTEERFTFKLSSCHLRHERNLIMTFDCEYMAYGRVNYVVLVFDVMLHRWSVG